MVRYCVVHDLGLVSGVRSCFDFRGNLAKARELSGGSALLTSLIYPDMFFIPLYLLTAGLLLRRHWLGSVLAFVAGGGVIYVMIYLLALSGLSGAVNLIADGIFLACTLISLWQVGCILLSIRKAV